MSDAPRQAGTVPVRVQVIDLEPRIVDLVVPTYLPADDLTQRIARDAGLGAWWPDGTRRAFWLRARGRVLDGDERLRDVGVVPWELLHLLPQPPPDEPVRERAPGLPDPLRTPVSRGARLLRVAGWAGLAALWAGAAAVVPTRALAFVPAVGVGFLAAAVPQGEADRAGMRAGVAVGLTLLGLAPAAWLGASLEPLFPALASLGGTAGLLLGLLSWMGPVAPIAAHHASAAEEAARREQVELACAICAAEAGADALEPCPYGCSRVFHRGCLRARQAVASGAGCEVCGARVRSA